MTYTLTAQFKICSSTMKIILIISVFTGTLSFPFNEEIKELKPENVITADDDTGHEIFNPDGHGYYEFQTLILYRKRPHCTGSMVTNYIMLLAAHCVEDDDQPSNYLVSFIILWIHHNKS